MRSWTKVLLATLAVVLVSSVAAMAGTVTLTITAVDNNANSASTSNSCTNASSCSVTLNSAVGTWSTNVDVGVTTDGAGNITSLDLATTNLTTSVPGSLTISFLIQGVVTPTGTHSYLFTSGGNIAAGNTGTSKLFQDPTNGSALTNQIGSTLGPYSGQPYSISQSGSFDFGQTTPYSLTLQTSLDATVANSVFSTDTHWKVPEPASLALMGVGLFGIGGIFRRKLRK